MLPVSLTHSDFQKLFTRPQVVPNRYVFLSFWKQKMVFWRLWVTEQFIGPTDFHIIGKKTTQSMGPINFLVITFWCIFCHFLYIYSLADALIRRNLNCTECIQFCQFMFVQWNSNPWSWRCYHHAVLFELPERTCAFPCVFCLKYSNVVKWLQYCL